MIQLHSAVIEYAWWIASLTALSFSLWGLREAMIDHAFLLATGMNGARKAVAEANQRGEAFRLAKCVVMVLASTASLFLPPPPPNYQELPQSLIGQIAWIVVALVMATHSFLDWQTRRKLAKYSADLHPTDPTTGHVIAEKGSSATSNVQDGATFEPRDCKDRREGGNGERR